MQFFNNQTTHALLEDLRTRRLHRNVVSVLTAGALVLGTSFATPALAGIALADTTSGGSYSAQTSGNVNESSNGEDEGGSDGEESEDSGSSEDADSSDDASDSEDASGDTSNESASSSSSNTSSDESATESTSTDDSSTTSTESEDEDLTDPDAAEANEEFGEPTTEVVIEGSVNGEIMAQIALAEPDGTPEGGDANKYNYGSGEAWCAYFVMYCARAAGLSTTVIPNYPNCAMLVAYYQGIDRWQDFTTEYKPHVGDLIFFSESKGGTASHIGIVTASTDTTVSTREGNTNGGQVASHTFSTTDEDGLIGNDYYILGYAAPEYPAEIEHEHTNEVASILDVSDTGHIVTYSDCVCGYSREPEIVTHNFVGTDRSLKLADSEDWTCIDCGATQKHYTTGILASAEKIELYDETETVVSKELPEGSTLAITSVNVGSDGNYWGTTAEGYKVPMASAGVKQREKFTEFDVEDNPEEIQTTIQAATTNGRRTIAQLGSVSLGGYGTEVDKSAESDTVNATAKAVAELKAGNIYLVTVGSIVSDSCYDSSSKYLGNPMIKLMSLGTKGTFDPEEMKVYGTNGYKLTYSDSTQAIVVVPDHDVSLVLACQYGKRQSCNDVTFNSVEVYQIG